RTTRQGGAASTGRAGRPEPAGGALGRTEGPSHGARQERRAILGVLREAGEDAPPLAPAPDLATVEALIEQVRGEGEIRFQVVGKRPERVPEAVELAAYRIVQESLTNSRRHAPGVPAEVTIAFDSDRVRLTIENSTIDGR